MRIKYMEVRQMRGINQSDVFPLIYAPILCAECTSVYIDTHTTPCPKGSTVTSHVLSSLFQASAVPTPWFSLIQLLEFSLLFPRPLLQEVLLNWEAVVLTSHPKSSASSSLSSGSYPKLS